MLVKIVHCDVVYRTVDFGVPSFFLGRLYCTIPTYKSHTYLPKSTIFFPPEQTQQLSCQATLVIGSPYGNCSEKEKFPKFYYTDYLRSLTYWIVGIFFQVSFGFVIISRIQIICRKYFQLRNIANRTKCNTFFDIQSDVM